MQFTLKKMLTVGMVVGVVGIMVFYAYFQSRAIVAGPQIDIFEPQNGMTSTSSLILIRGVAVRAKEITLDGRQILIDLEGHFGEYLLLAEGYNIIELAARDAQGTTVRKTLEIVYQKPVSTINP